MNIRNKWLLLPPAAALLLFLGPLRPEASNPTPNAASTATPAAAGTSTGVQTPSLPRAPELWQYGSTLIGVLLLGAAGLFVFARTRTGARPTGEKTIAVRQSVRLGQKQQLFAIEFDERLLLVGASDGRLCLLHEGRLPERAADEALVAARVDELVEDDADVDQGAVPKNLLIPRPQPPLQPRPRRSPAGANPSLGNFRTLLQKAGRA